MEHSDGDHEEGRPPSYYQQQQQQQTPQARPQGQPYSTVATLPAWSLQHQQFQQQQELYLRQQGEAAAYASAAASLSTSVGGGGTSGGHLSDQHHHIAPSLQHQHPNDYLLAHHQQQQQQQRYLQQQQQQQQQYDVATTLGSRYPPGVPQQQQQQQFAQQFSYQQQLAMQMAAVARQQQQQQQSLPHATMDSTLLAAAVAGLPPHLQPHHLQHHHPSIPPPPVPLPSSHPAPILQQQQQQTHPTVPARVGRLPADRPIVKLSLTLIDTYKHINDVYYQEREARKAAKAKEEKAAASAAKRAFDKQKLQQQQQQQQQALPQQPSSSSTSAKQPLQQGSGTNNNGWDDDNYDYIINTGELFYNGRYRIKERIGKGSFGQVVRADDLQDNVEVAIKIIKSKKPFLMQAKTEIELLTHLNDKDTDDQHNIVRLLRHFMYRNHQCLVFEMLSLNLYELLKNTQFGGVSLNLIRKFAKQVLKALAFLARKDVDIIHCDLKPENILLRHPKKSGVKVIDFGSSCRSDKRMYSYIQSRFYRSPEVMLGLPYSVSIDIWSLGCILAEMHTGEPLFSGSDQFDQMQKIVKLLGMVPDHMLEQSTDQHRLQFFERAVDGTGRVGWTIKQQNTTGTTSRSGTTGSQSQKQPQSSTPKSPIIPSTDPITSLMEVIRADTLRKKKYPTNETGNSPQNYELFVDLIHRMLAYDPSKRIKPLEALEHPFIIGAGS